MALVMYPNDPAPADLLKYLPDYGVVICTSCSYAVQPKAISRHLKEIHRVLRSRRRKFDLYVIGLALRDPQDVEPPTLPGQFPVPDLPVEDGFRCRRPGCEHMCVSTKRMEAHWRENHGRKGYLHEDFISAPLQTFFRGNLLRYFTSPDSATAGLGTPVSLSHSGFSCTDIHIPENTRSVLHITDTSLLTHYFTATHHTFITGPETTHLWASVIPTLATQHDFLLHGLLACTALHKAYLSPDADTKRQYTLLAYKHQAIALPEFQLTITNPTEENCHALLAFSHLLIIYSFASSSTDIDDPETQISPFFQDPNDNEPDMQPLPNWLYFIRGSCSMLQSVMRSILAGPGHVLINAWGSRPREENYGGRETVLLRHLLSILPSPSLPISTEQHIWTDINIQIYTAAAKQLNTTFLYLQHRAPEHITAWNILRVWPMTVSLEYFTLLQQNHPGALILLAHYCILLRRMERYWYFEGKAAALVRLIRRRLGGEWRGWVEGAMESVLAGGDQGGWVAMFEE
ncbi:hypothetical protein BJX70DRAFT_391020 [Aspergillus crustosus]